jgi:hypothetical protein
MRNLLFVAALAASLGASAAAFAQSSDGASLTLVAAGPSQLIQDGAQWRCEGLTCRAPRVKGLPALHACKRLVGEVGAVAAFTWRGKSLDAGQLAACNAAARS